MVVKELIYLGSGKWNSLLLGTRRNNGQNDFFPHQLFLERRESTDGIYVQNTNQTGGCLQIWNLDHARRGFGPGLNGTLKVLLRMISYGGRCVVV